MTALLCEEYQWSNYSYIGRPRRRPVLIFHRLPRERSERAPKSTANNGSSEPPLRHAPRGLSEQTAKHWLSPRRAENRDKMIKNCQPGLAITRSAVSQRQDKSLRFFSSLLPLCKPQAGPWEPGGVGVSPPGWRGLTQGLVSGGIALASGLGVGTEAAGNPRGPWRPRHSPARWAQKVSFAHSSGKTQGTPVGGRGLEHTCSDPPAGAPSRGSPGPGAPWDSRDRPPDPAMYHLDPTPSDLRLGTLTTGPKEPPLVRAMGEEKGVPICTSTPRSGSDLQEWLLGIYTFGPEAEPWPST